MWVCVVAKARNYGVDVRREKREERKKKSENPVCQN
jgi:hypothetical protein